MAAQTTTNVYEEVFENLRKAAEANLKMQQEMLNQWSSLWPGLPAPQSAWLDKLRNFQKQWNETISALAHKHRELLNRQYQAALESLDEALRTSEASNSEEFRDRAEQLCRKTLDCMREVTEAQMEQFQKAAAKWSTLLTNPRS